MQKLLWALMIIICGLFSEEGWSQTKTEDDTLAIKQMLGDLKLLSDSDLDSALQLSIEVQKKSC